jgi:hypothetical protein
MMQVFFSMLTLERISVFPLQALNRKVIQSGNGEI